MDNPTNGMNEATHDQMTSTIEAPPPSYLGQPDYGSPGMWTWQVPPIIEVNQVGGSAEREEFLRVLTQLAAADLPNTSSETRHRDRHLWLGGLAKIAFEIIEIADDYYDNDLENDELGE